jgi:hypothetical protein
LKVFYALVIRYEWNMKGLEIRLRAELQIHPWVLAGERDNPGVYDRAHSRFLGKKLTRKNKYTKYK